jgi:hypothetical protein
VKPPPDATDIAHKTGDIVRYELPTATGFGGKKHLVIVR